MTETEEFNREEFRELLFKCAGALAACLKEQRKPLSFEKKKKTLINLSGNYGR